MRRSGPDPSRRSRDSPRTPAPLKGSWLACYALLTCLAFATRRSLAASLLHFHDRPNCQRESVGPVAAGSLLRRRTFASSIVSPTFSADPAARWRLGRPCRCDDVFARQVRYYRLPPGGSTPHRGIHRHQVDLGFVTSCSSLGFAPDTGSGFSRRFRSIYRIPSAFRLACTWARHLL